MQRRPFALLLLAPLLALGAAPGRAQQAGPPQPLPLHEVVLFSSGVGYFQRSGRVADATNIDLSFRAEQVNDILKSLVLFDPNGNVRPVTYTTNEGTSGRLNRVGKALDGTISLGALLRQFQGARVRLEVGTDAVEGRVVSVSMKPIPVKEAGVVQTEVLNVLTEGGLRAVPLESISQVKLLDERLDRELRESLEILAGGLDDQRRNVQLHFGGGGAREVRAGYLQEMPVWKTSYRLVLDDKQKPYLQGWGIVENTTDEDWKDVRLSLVSGRPVSFIQDLYQPLYVPRPVVAPQIVGSPVPQTYGETLTKLDRELQQQAQAVDAPAPDFAKAGPRGPLGPGGGFGGAGFGVNGQVSEEQLKRARSAGEARRDAVLSSDALAKSVAAQAQGTERGDLFEYAISTPVSLPKGQAAMVPIVSTLVAGEQLSIFDPESDAAHALNGFRIKNTTGLHLSGGPVTVFRDGAYAGDAQITNVQPNEDRLISYAVDLDLVAKREEPKFRQDTLDISAKSGVLIIKRKQQRENTYTFRNKSDDAKTVLVEQRQEPEFKVIDPIKPTEETPDKWRFTVAVPAGKTAALKVVTERPVTETIALLDIDLNLLVSYAQNGQVSERLRASLKTLVALRRKITDLQNQRAALDGELKAIDHEQTRIRQNMAQLDRNSTLYQQYVKKLTEQETRIEKIRDQMADLRQAEEAAQKELRAYVDTLTAE